MFYILTHHIMLDNIVQIITYLKLLHDMIILS